jgi:hypothetical protein
LFGQVLVQIHRTGDMEYLFLLIQQLVDTFDGGNLGHVFGVKGQPCLRWMGIGTQLLPQVTTQATRPLSHRGLFPKPLLDQGEPVPVGQGQRGYLCPGKIDKSVRATQARRR